MIYEFDVCSEPQTLENFVKTFQTGIDGGGTTDFYSLCRDVLNESKFKQTKIGTVIELIHTSIRNLKCGHIVKLDFIPNSQDYIDYYEEQNVIGRVFFIDVENDDALVYHDKINENGEHVRVVKSFNRPYCSYFGTTRGYDYIVSKLTMKVSRK